MVRGELDQFAAQHARVPQPQHGAAANGAALRLDRMAGERDQRCRERFAVRAQRADRALHLARLSGVEPGAKRQRPMRLGDAEKFEIALDAGAIRRGQPVHQHLPLRQQQRVGAIEPVVQTGYFITRPAFQARHPPARPHQHDGGEDGKDNEPDHRQQDRNFMPIELADGAERRIVGAGKCRPHGCRGRQQTRRRHATDKQISRMESALPRMRIAARPDRLRHAPCLYRLPPLPVPHPSSPAAGKQRVAAHPTNQTTLLSTGFAPKKSRS